MNKKVETILVAQICKEAYSDYLYLAMASWAENNGLPGTAQWLYAQAEEERIHMLKLVKFVNERGGKAIIPEVKQPPIDHIDINELFAAVLKHEQFITHSINECVATCMEEKDFSTLNFLQWYVTEQIEEEASVKAIIDTLNLVGDHSMYQFDKDILAMRTQNKPAGKGTTSA